MSDKSFLNRILLACSRGSTRLFRQNVGVAWVGKTWRVPSRQTITLDPGDVVIKNARPFHSGVAGMGDLLGWRSIKITPDMVGDTVALFVSLEAKEGTGRLSPEQRNWRDQVLNAGGIAAEVRSVEEATRVLGD